MEMRNFTQNTSKRNNYTERRPALLRQKAMANKEPTRIELFIQDDSEELRQLISLFKLCGRKKSRIIAFIVSVFLDEFGLDIDTLKRDDLEQLMKVYPLLKKYASKPNIAECLAAIAKNSARNNDNGYTLSLKTATPSEMQFQHKNDNYDRGKAALEVFGI